MKITKKNGKTSIRLSDYPNSEQLKELNSLGTNEYFMCEARGYKRLLVRSYGRDVLPCVMECPINEYFRD